jgi:hypothetical protein
MIVMVAEELADCGRIVEAAIGRTSKEDVRYWLDSSRNWIQICRYLWKRLSASHLRKEDEIKGLLSWSKRLLLSFLISAKLARLDGKTYGEGDATHLLPFSSPPPCSL